MAKLIHLIKEGQRLAADALEQRITDYAARCEAWKLKVEQALKRKRLALARFREAQPLNMLQSGITYGTMNDLALLRGHLFVLIQIEKEAKQERRAAINSWVVATIGLIGVWAILEGWFVDAFHMIKYWFTS